ncbi:MAG: hypothetical protein M3116_03625, partial [Actinomycetota bacterium]|nr:hypothetical protein [Actinomycetota bacterium]
MSASQRWPVGLAGSATLLSAAGAAMLILFATELASRGLDWVPWTVSIGLAAPLLFAALAVLLRRHARLDARRAVLFTVLAVAACWAALAALLSWSAGFDAADEGRDASGSTRAALIAVVAAWLLGSAAVAA